MGKYRIYSKVYEKGVPMGRAFANTRRTFSSRSAALSFARKDNASWNRTGRLAANKIQAKVAKVVAVRKRIARRANVGARSGLEYLGLR